MTYLRVFLWAALLLFFSCKKDNANPKTEAEKSLPTFENVDLDDVFTKKDSQLHNRDSVVTVLGDYYKNVWEAGDLSGGFLIAKGDDILYENYRGFGREGNQMPIDKNTPLHVASVSKTITAMTLMKLVEAGKVNLEDPVTKFFPQFPYPNVTVLSLVTQRSGLPKYEHFIEKITPQPQEMTKTFITNQDVLNMLIKYKPELARETNTGFMYCNTNFALLALIIEKATSVPLPEAIKIMVFDPLKMKHSYIFQEKDIPTASQSFYNRGNKLYPLDRLDLIYGDKNVYTTPRDLYNFSKAMFAPNFLRKDLMNMVFEPYSNEKPGINNYGIGFRMKIFDDNEKLTYHNGWWHGSNTVFGHLLKSKVTIIAIGNKYSQRVYSALALSAIFENFPYETQKLNEALNIEQDSASLSKDSAQVSSE